MKNTILFTLILFFISCSETKKEDNTSAKDFSKDETVLEEVNRIQKNKMTKDDICIDRPKMFKGLVLVGFFAHDRGCDGGMMFYNGKEVDKYTGYPEILRAAGWDDRAKREVIALEWVKKVSLAWEYPMEYEDEEFKSYEVHEFMPPTVKTENGEVIVAIWVREPSGMNPEASYYLYTAAFSIEEADVIRTQITDRFTVEY